jgi:hypothetical protein
MEYYAETTQQGHEVLDEDQIIRSFIDEIKSLPSTIPFDFGVRVRGFNFGAPASMLEPQPRSLDLGRK